MDFQILGLVKDTKYQDLREDFTPIVYLPVSQEPDHYPGLQVVVRASAPFADITARIRSAAAQVNPEINMTFRNFKTMISESLLQERLMATLSGFFGFLAALLATVALVKAKMLFTPVPVMWPELVTLAKPVSARIPYWPPVMLALALLVEQKPGRHYQLRDPGGHAMRAL